MKASKAIRLRLTRYRLVQQRKDIRDLQRSKYASKLKIFPIKAAGMFDVKNVARNLVFCETVEAIEKTIESQFSNLAFIEIGIVAGGYLVSQNIKANVEPLTCTFLPSELEGVLVFAPFK